MVDHHHPPQSKQVVRHFDYWFITTGSNGPISFIFVEETRRVKQTKLIHGAASLVCHITFVSVTIWVQPDTRNLLSWTTNKLLKWTSYAPIVMLVYSCNRVFCFTFIFNGWLKKTSKRKRNSRIILLKEPLVNLLGSL